MSDPTQADFFVGASSESIDATVITRASLQAIPGFDYTGLDPQRAEHIRAVAERIRRIEPAIGLMVFEAGCHLLEVKDVLGHGNFGRWLEAEGINPKTAQNYMNVARAFAAEYETVSHLPQRLLYRLAAPSCPPEFRQQLIADLRDGAPAEAATIEDALRLAKAHGRENLTVTERVRAARRAAQKRAVAKTRRVLDRAAREKVAMDELSTLIVGIAGDRLPKLLSLLRAAGSSTAKDLRKAIKASRTPSA
jgi:hypothetical protein